jgi:phosphoglycerate kinase
LRADFNVPLAARQIRDDYKIRQGLDTIKWLLARGARVIVATHLAEPTRRSAAYSVKPIAVRLRALLKHPVKFLSGAIEAPVAAAVKKMRPGEIIMLENLRFYKGEYANDAHFAKALASLADIYINDAFAVSHRAQASLAAIKKYLPSYAGCLLEKEIKALNKILHPHKPLVVVMGGVKAATKTPLIARLYPRAARILLGGALANNFLKYQGYPVGRSLVPADQNAAVKKFFSGRKLKSKIMLPVDVVVQNKKGQVRVSAPAGVKPDESILDIGPATITAYAAVIKGAQTLVWNGPMGKFEEKTFKYGTLAVASLVAARSSGLAYGVIGGGETVAALQLTKMAEYVDWISTAGGAMLTYLGGGAMPGLKK